MTDRRDSTEDLAAQLREVAPDLDAARRSRMRYQVLRDVPSGPRPSDRVFDVFALLSQATPFLLHGIAVLVISASLLAMVTAASADSLPDEPLYGLKVAAEQVRLSLAQRPEDRAGVELSIAEHRLLEAERLAAAGRANATFVASSAYGTHIANAAAELAQIESLEPHGAGLAKQLETRLIQQQAKAAVIAERLAANPATEQAGVALATVAAAQGGTGEGSLAVRIAETAAQVAEDLASVAAERAQLPTAPPRTAEPAVAEEDVEETEPAPTAEPAATVRPRETARTTTTPRPTVRATATPRAAATGATGDVRAAAATAAATPTPRRTATAKPTATPRPTLPAKLKPTGTPNASARAAAATAQKAAQAARKAADRAKAAAKKTATPKPTPRPTIRP